MRTLTPKELAFLRQQPISGPNKVRMALGLIGATQQDLADSADVKAPHLSDIIHGRYSRIALETTRRIARALGACIEDVFPPHCLTPERRDGADRRRTTIKRRKADKRTGKDRREKVAA